MGTHPAPSREDQQAFARLRMQQAQAPTQKEQVMIVIVGVGALGSHLVQFMRNEKIEIKIIDFDRVEQKNVMSQFHGKPGVGKSKVDALKQAMDFFFKRTVQTVGHKLVDNNIDQLLKGATLVVDCLDNGASRKLVQDYVRTHNVPCLHGALAP